MKKCKSLILQIIENEDYENLKKILKKMKKNSNYKMMKNYKDMHILILKDIKRVFVGKPKNKILKMNEIT